jgi:hypothetical protein
MKFLKKIIKNFFNRAMSDFMVEIRETENSINFLKSENEILKLMIGKVLTNQIKNVDNLSSIEAAEFKIFSQFGDDGIIQYLINKIDIPNKTFIEFGVENYFESNTRFLLINNNWRGMVMDGSLENIEEIKKKYYHWQYDLLAVHAFIDSDNVNLLISKANFEAEVGILNIDIDGNDYWIWKAINVINPIIVIVEFNSVFGIDKHWTIPYDPKFFRVEAHHSFLYYGSSLLSLCDLAEEKGYHFVGCNSAGNNSYFVRKDKIGDVKILRPEEGYVISNFSESHDEKRRKTFLRGKERLDSLKGQKVFNTKTGVVEYI